MSRPISPTEAKGAAAHVPIPTLRLPVDLFTGHTMQRYIAIRGDRAMGDLGLWLMASCLAAQAENHRLGYNVSELTVIVGQSDPSPVAESVSALVSSGLMTFTDDGYIELPLVNEEAIRFGKMIVGGRRGGRPRGKRGR